MGKELRGQLDGLTRLDTFIDIVGNSLPLPYQKKQQILETVDLRRRYEVLLEILSDETDILQIKNDIQQKVKDSRALRRRIMYCGSSRRSSGRSWVRRIPSQRPTSLRRQWNN